MFTDEFLILAGLGSLLLALLFGAIGLPVLMFICAFIFIAAGIAMLIQAVIMINWSKAYNYKDIKIELPKIKIWKD